VTLSWCADETAHPVAVKGSSIAWVWFGGKTFSWAAAVGLQADAGKFSALATPSVALALAPGARVIEAGAFDGLRVAAAPICAPDELVSETPGYPNSVHVDAPLLVKSRIVKSVPAPAPPLPSVMCRFDVEHDGAPAGAPLVCVAGAELEGGAAGLLAGELAAETPELEADAGLVAWLALPELFELQPTARIAAVAAIPPVSEFWKIRALKAIRAFPSAKSSDDHVRITTSTTRHPARWLQ
jgi:hypothetical protein